jgi:ATP-dependent helicase/nuclease subunit B
VDLLVVDGYDQFSTLQAELLAALGDRTAEALVTLTQVPGREDTVGRRFTKTRQHLEAVFKNNGLAWSPKSLTGRMDDRHPDLQRLADEIFQLDTEPTPSTGAVHFLSSPDVATETSTVLREVKRLLLPDEEGLTHNLPEDIIVVLRDYERYHTHLRALAREYDLPSVLHLGQPLSDLPPIRLLLDALSLHDTSIHLTDFPRRLLLDVLRSPYCEVPGLDADIVRLLDQISQSFQVVGGREDWLIAVEAASRGRLVGEEDRDTHEIEPLISEQERDDILNALTTFFDRVTPRPIATVVDYVMWLEELIGADRPPTDDDPEDTDGYLSMVNCLHHGQRPWVVNRDLAALDEFKGVLRGLLSAQVLLSTLEQTAEVIHWADFWVDLLASLERASIDQQPERHGRVLITTAANARGLPHKHVFIMGLSEGMFPVKLTEDPLYLDSERRQMANTGLPIEVAADMGGDEGLYYELISLPRQSLTLSRPTIQNGAPWVESHLWRATAAVFSDSVDLVRAGEQRAGAVVAVEQSVTVNDVLVAVSEGFLKTQPHESVAGAYNWLMANHKPVWMGVQTGRTVEFGRLSGESFDAYTGRIQDEHLLNELGKLLGPGHTWSASQLNDYGLCPFRFFAGRVLRLEEQTEPMPGMDARQLGSLNHAILEQTYRQLMDEDIEISPENTEIALDILDEVAAEQFERAPRDLGFRTSVVWDEEQEILVGRLRALVFHDFNDVADELTKSFGTATRTPYRMEAGFGTGERGLNIDLGDDVPHGVRITGFIDRMDRYGDDVLVMDYKTGGTAIRLDELEAGRNFQIMLYMVAAERMLAGRRGIEDDVPASVQGGFFWHIRNRRISGLLNGSDPSHADLIQQARETIVTYVRSAQSGDFSVRPSKLEDGKCAAYCAFYRLCRVAVTHPAKRAQA